MTVQQAHTAHQVKDQVRQKFPAVYDVLVHVEPGQIPPSSRRVGWRSQFSLICARSFSERICSH
jgi:divalent metal cation (Fe/Co/Zn/Cd) transporter